MNSQNPTALVLYTGSVNEPVTEYLRPIAPSAPNSRVGDAAVNSQNCRSHLRDFLYALLLGLAVFGTAAVSVYTDIASLIFTYL